MVAALLAGCAPITRAPALALHHRRVCAVRCDARPTERARRDIPLPGNQGLLLDRTAHDHDVVCAPAGQSWVLQRPRRGGPGLVLSSRLTGLQLADAPAALPKQSYVALAAVEDSVQGDVSVFGATDWYDITDYQLLDEEESGIDRQLADACSSAASECLGLVLREDASRVQSKEEVSPLSKRRTRKVRFTCNLCGETSTKAVSPHAWASGSVFARCDGCRVIHKLVDNLKLFHELSGPVFPPRKISTLRIPPGLPQQPTLDHHMHPGIWDPDSKDAPFKQRQLQVQAQLVLDRGCYELGSTVHGTVVLTCRERVYVKCLDVAVHGFELVRFKERTHGWHEFLPLQPPAFEHQAQRQLCYAGAELLRSADGLRLDSGRHPYKVTWELPACDAEGEPLPGTFASKAARVVYYLEVRCWINSPLGLPPDVRQCFQLHVCQVEREPAWIATRHVIKKCFTNVSTEYLLYAPPAGDVLFGVALERLTWAPGEAVCFDFVAESYSGIEFTRIQVTLVRTINASAPRTNDLERAKHTPLGSSELERLRSAGLAPVPKHAFSARHWQVLCEAEEYEGRPAWMEQRRATNTKQQRGALWKQVISLPKPLKGGSQLVRFQLPADLLAEQTVRTARITCSDYLAITLLGRGLSPDKPEVWLPFKVAYPSPTAPPAAG